MTAGPRYIALARTAQRTSPQHPFHCFVRFCCDHYPATAVVNRAITQQRLLYFCLFRGRCLATGLRVIIYILAAVVVREEMLDLMALREQNSGY
jgi:hypothetical protein